MQYDKTLPKAFARAVRTLRHRAGFSQEQLALEAGLSRSHLSDLERGLRLPKLDTLMQIARTLKVPLSALAREIERNLKDD